VGGVQEIVTELVVTGGALTTIENGDNDAESVPSVTLMTMLASVPTSPVPGVPDSWPVVVLKAAQVGLFWIENVSAFPAGSLAVGVNE